MVTTAKFQNCEVIVQDGILMFRIELLPTLAIPRSIRVGLSKHEPIVQKRKDGGQTLLSVDHRIFQAARLRTDRSLQIDHRNRVALKNGIYEIRSRVSRPNGIALEFRL